MATKDLYSLIRIRKWDVDEKQRALGVLLRKEESILNNLAALADEMREHLPLFLARQIRTRRRSRQVELWRIAGMLGHGAGAA